MRKSPGSGVSQEIGLIAAIANRRLNARGTLLSFTLVAERRLNFDDTEGSALATLPRKQASHAFFPSCIFNRPKWENSQCRDYSIWPRSRGWNASPRQTSLA